MATLLRAPRVVHLAPRAVVASLAFALAIVAACGGPGPNHARPPDCKVEVLPNPPGEGYVEVGQMDFGAQVMFKSQYQYRSPYTLAADMRQQICAVGGDTPGIQFTESNVSGAMPQACPPTSATSVAAVCGRGASGIGCAISNGTTSGTDTVWQSGFSDANGWNGGPQYYSTVRFADINGDGNVDVCGRGSNGIDCAVANGTSFSGYSLWQSGFSDANGWAGGVQYYSTIQFADIDGDGRADVCGRGSNGIDCALSNGTSFGGYSLWQSGFSDANGWAGGAQYYSTIRFADINGDGLADVCGRGSNGIDCSLSNGTNFGSYSPRQSGFSDANGWNGGPQYYSTIQFADINGDGKADVCGRGSNGIDCALSNGSGFDNYSLWQSDFSDANGWTGQQYYSTIRFIDVNGDGKADVCGRGSTGIDCALSNGTSFGTATLWQQGFSDSNGWNAGPQYYSTIQFADINGDRRADVCGRGSTGIDCALSNGTSFGTATLWQAAFSDANGWSSAQYYSTIRLPDPLELPN